MKILILSWRGPGHPNAGGAEIVTFAHAKAWVKAGYEVTLFTSSYQGAIPNQVIHGVKIIRRGEQIIGVRLQALLWYLFLKQEKFDLIIDEFHGLPFFTPLFTRVRKIGFIHEVAKEVWWLNNWPKPLNLIPGIVGSVFEPLLFKWVYRRIHFMTVSQSTKKDLSAWSIPESKIHIIYNGCDFPDQNIKYKKEVNKTIIYLGALSKDKGIEDALKAFKEIAKSRADWRFWVVGKGENNYQKYLHHLAAKYGIGERIKFWGFVSNDKKYELLSKAHVLINPSVREGWGLVVIEANFCYTPVVGYDVPGLRDSIVHNKTGFLCRTNPQDMASQVIRILDDEKSYQVFQKNAKDWSLTFSWENCTRQSLDLIEKLVSAK